MLKLQNMCPHAIVVKEGDQWVIKPCVVSPFGTHNWYCNQCQGSFHQRPSDSYFEQFRKQPKQLIDMEKAFHKEAKKMGILPRNF